MVLPTSTGLGRVTARLNTWGSPRAFCPGLSTETVWRIYAAVPPLLLPPLELLDVLPPLLLLELLLLPPLLLEVLPPLELLEVLLPPLLELELE
jgi:hypothetical protein